MGVTVTVAMTVVIIVVVLMFVFVPVFAVAMIIVAVTSVVIVSHFAGSKPDFTPFCQGANPPWTAGVARPRLGE